MTTVYLFDTEKVINVYKNWTDFSESFHGHVYMPNTWVYDPEDIMQPWLHCNRAGMFQHATVNDVPPKIRAMCLLMGI